MNTPKKFKKKPVVIEAMQWDGTALGATPIVDWIFKNGGSATYGCTTDQCSNLDDDHAIFIHTLEGKMETSPQDFVIRGIEGEFYPCKPSIFKDSYEDVL